MQQTNGVAVLATHLAHTDRRALSQAWYSALHLADSTPLRQHAAPAPATSSPGMSPPCAARGSGAALAAPAPWSVRAADDMRTRVAAGDPRGAAGRLRGERTTAHDAVIPRDANSRAAERRAPSELARRIERALNRRSAHEQAASFTVNAAGGRVHLIVRSDGGRTRVVAVCAPPLRERVERALAHVRFAFAGRGLLAEVA